MNRAEVVIYISTWSCILMNRVCCPDYVDIHITHIRWVMGKQQRKIHVTGDYGVKRVEKMQARAMKHASTKIRTHRSQCKGHILRVNTVSSKMSYAVLIIK